MSGWLVHSFCLDCDAWRDVILHPSLNHKNTSATAQALFTCNGQTKSLKEWAAFNGMTIDGLRQRLYRGWTMQRAIETPVRKQRQPKRGKRR